MIVCFMLELYESDIFIQRTFHTTKESAENLSNILQVMKMGITR